MSKTLTLLITISVMWPLNVLAKDLEFINQCPKKIKTCLNMDLNFGSKDSNAVLLISSTDEDYNSQSLLYVRGSLKGADQKSYKVLFKSFAGAIAATDFGQGTVAVLGYSNKKEPILLTDKGELTVKDGSLRVGCKSCIRLIDKKTKKPKVEFDSPTWDLTKLGIKGSSFNYDSKANLYLRHNGECLWLKQNDRFEETSSSKCKKMRLLGNFKKDPKIKGIKLGPAQWLYRGLGDPYYFLLESGAY